ncbi:hypothetical protein C5S31_03855 [ANME-1 cluster archaeon GoMg2]|nr:hypothetical protein [ANME-1 cluster archaeon GoMg2]
MIDPEDAMIAGIALINNETVLNKISNTSLVYVI